MNAPIATCWVIRLALLFGRFAMCRCDEIVHRAREGDEIKDAARQNPFPNATTLIHQVSRLGEIVSL